MPLHGDCFGRPAVAEQEACLPLTLTLLTERGQDLRNSVLPKRLPQQLDDGTCLDRLSLLWISDSDDLKAMVLLQSQELQKLRRTDQSKFVHHNDAVALERNSAADCAIEEDG
jgi:hypothetical protein